MRTMSNIVMLLLLAVQISQGQKELAGAYIDANDLCPPKPAAPSVQPATPERSGSALGRLFRPSASSQPAPPPPAAACTPVKYCDKLPAVIQRCKTTFGCKAVSYDGRCGLLKAASEPRRNRRGWSTYVVG